MIGISRIESEGSNSIGWFVRINYGKGEEHRKFFSDNKYGGKKKALERAKAYRSEYIEKKPPPEKLPFQREPIASNTSGVSGISETFNRNRRTGEKLLCYQVFYAPRENERKQKRFYFHHYENKKEAFEAAVKFRKEMEAEILKKHKAGKR